MENNPCPSRALVSASRSVLLGTSRRRCMSSSSFSSNSPRVSLSPARYTPWLPRPGLVLIGLWRSGSSGCQFTRTSQPSSLQLSPAVPNSGGFGAVTAAVSTRPIWLMRPLA